MKTARNSLRRPVKARRVLGLTALTMPIVMVGCAAAAPGATTSTLPVAPVPSASTSSASVAVPAVLGPQGVGAIALGMTKAQVAATGLATGIEGTQGSCGQTSDGRLIGTLPAADQDPVGRLYFATDTGTLVAIGAAEGMYTKEGIGLGSTLPAVKKAYPKWKGDETGGQGMGVVSVPGNSSAVYRIYLDAGHVMELSVQAKVQSCLK